MHGVEIHGHAVQTNSLKEKMRRRKQAVSQKETSGEEISEEWKRRRQNSLENERNEDIVNLRETG